MGAPSPAFPWPLALDAVTAAPPAVGWAEQLFAQILNINPAVKDNAGSADCSRGPGLAGAGVPCVEQVPSALWQGLMSS